jgi:SAM-dependent methyltransferase
MKLNLGSGKTLIPGYINIDILEYGQEIKRDITTGLPFSNASITEVYTCHFLEHLKVGPDVMFVMHEIWRVLTSNGKLVARVPHADSPGASDRAHHSYWDYTKLVDILNAGVRTCSNHSFNFSIISSGRKGDDFLFILRALKYKIYFPVDGGFYEDYLVAHKIER